MCEGSNIEKANAWWIFAWWNFQRGSFFSLCCWSLAHAFIIYVLGVRSRFVNARVSQKWNCGGGKSETHFTFQPRADGAKNDAADLTWTTCLCPGEWCRPLFSAPASLLLRTYATLPGRLLQALSQSQMCDGEQRQFYQTKLIFRLTILWSSFIDEFCSEYYL